MGIIPNNSSAKARLLAPVIFTLGFAFKPLDLILCCVVNQIVNRLFQKSATSQPYSKLALTVREQA